MTKLNIKTSKKVVPMCYAYTTPQIKDHDGWTKIGFTEQDVDTRIRQQTQTADIEYKIEWKANAIYDDGSGDIFHDTDFHGYLKKVGIERKTGTEWFHILPQVSKQRFDEFRANRGVSQTDAVIEYKLREEQQKAVEQAKAYFKNHTEEDAEFLWNAKPRFGKTLSAYDLCKQLDAKTVLIVTHRPAIATSWYSDYEKFLGTQSGYYFISQADALKDKPSVVKRENLPASARKYIEFVSLQDLKGAIEFGGKYDKLNHISKLKWDLLIIDEAHEGIDTYRADIALDNIHRKYTLHLNFFPVYGEDDDGEMITLDAEKVLTIPRKIHAQEVVRKGFMCNFLFQNISNIFNAPQEVIDIIHNFEPQKEPVIITPETKNELSINDEGNIEISENIIIGKADNIFGPKIYEEAKEELIEAVETIAKENQDKKEPDAIIEKMKEKFGEVANSLINTAQDSYGKDLSKSTKKALQRELDRKANAIIATQCTKHIIEQNVIERNRKKELEEASSTTEKEQINHKFDKEKLASQDKFLEEMKTAIEELPKTFGETVVKAVETDSKQREKNSIEDGVRDHLRGFSRTIPSFLMAYGNENTTLENFDTIIPDEVFKEVTSISLEEFRFLRDGGDYVDEQAGETKHFEGQLYPLLLNWWKCSNVTALEKNDIPLENIAKLYEYLCLFKIFDAINSVLNITPLKHDSTLLLKSKQYIWTLEQGETITLFYEPIIFSIPKETGLIRVSKTQDERYNYYTPDFVIKYCNKGYETFCILDAKFSNVKIDNIFKYFTDITNEQFNRDNIILISIIKPEFANTAYKYNSLYINDIFSKNVTLPELSEIYLSAPKSKTKLQDIIQIFIKISKEKYFEKNPISRKKYTYKSSSILDDTKISLIKGMILRGDNLQDIAFWFGVNLGRISEIKSGIKYNDILPADKNNLPPQGPYPSLSELFKQ